MNDKFFVFFSFSKRSCASVRSTDGADNIIIQKLPVNENQQNGKTDKQTKNKKKQLIRLRTTGCRFPIYNNNIIEIEKEKPPHTAYK